MPVPPLARRDRLITSQINTAPKHALDNTRVVVDNRYSKIADVDAEKQIAESMKYLSGKGKFSFSDAMLILKDGTAKLIK